MMVFHKIPKWLSIVLISLFASLCIAFFFQKVTKRHLSEVLKSQINENIPVGYRLKYNKLDLNLTRKQLALRNFQLIPKANNDQNRTLQFEVPYLRLKIGSFWDPIFRRTLNVRLVELEEAKIKVIDLKSPQNKTLAEESSSILDTLDHYLSRLKIGDLKIQGTQLTYEDQRKSNPRRFHIDRLDLNVLGFSIDSSLSKHGFLNSRQVEAYISGEDLTLPDGKHHFAFESCRLSTRRKTLQFTNVNLQPKDSTSLKEMSMNSGFIIAKIPELSFKGIDFKKPYLDTSLQMEVLHLKSPTIIYQKQQQTSKNTNQENLGKMAIRRSLKQLSSNIKIKKIVLDNASIDLDFSPNKKKEVAFDIDSVIVYDFEVNQESLLFDQNYLPFKSIDISISNIQQKLSSKLGSVEIDHARLNTGTSSIQLENISIGNDSIKGIFHQSIPRLWLSGIDIFKTIGNKQVLVDEIFLENPVTYIPDQDFTPSNASRTKSIFQSIDDFFSSFFINEVKAKTFNINGGRIRYENVFSVDRYDYQGARIQLDSNANTWTEIIPRFNLIAEGIKFQDKKDGVYKLDFLERDTNTTEFNGLSILQEGPQNHLDVSLHSGRFQKLRVEKLLDGIIKADSLILNQPIVNFKQKQKTADKEEIPKSDFDLKINNIIVKQAKTQFIGASGDTLNINKWNLSGNWEAALDVQQFDLSQFYFISHKLPFTIYASRFLQLPSKNSFRIQGIQLEPLEDRSQQDSTFLIPSLDILGFDFDFLVDEKGFKAQSVKLKESSGFLMLPEQFSTSQKKGIQDLFPIILDSLIWTNARMAAYRDQDALSSALPSINLKVIGLNTSRKDSLAAWCDYFTLGLKEGLYLDHKKFTLNIGPVDLQSQQASVSLEEVYYLNKQAGQVHSLRLRDLRIDSSALIAGINNGVLDLGHVKVGAGDVTIIPNSKLFNSSKSRINLPDFTTKSVNIQNLNIDLQGEPNFKVKDLTIQADYIRYDSNFNLNNYEQFIKSLYVFSDQVHFDAGRKNAYALDFGFEFNADQQLTKINHFSLQPNFLTNEYWRIKAGQIAISDLSIPEILQEKIHVPKIKIDDLSAKDFNNQNIENPSVIKPLWTDQLKAIESSFLIDTLKIKGDLSYQALTKSKHDSIWVHFDQIDAEVNHITNIPAHYDQPMMLQANALMYGDAPLEITVDFDLARTDAYFTLEGKIKDFQLKRLSYITAPQSFVHIERGFSRNIQFSFAANDKVSTGELYFNYKKLKFRILDKEDPNKYSFGNKIKSFLANQLVVSNNPNLTGKHKGVIYFERLRHKSIINFWVRSISSGIADGAGLRNNIHRTKKSPYNLSKHQFKKLQK